jgi:hypothetical protein
LAMSPPHEVVFGIWHLEFSGRKARPQGLVTKATRSAS